MTCGRIVTRHAGPVVRCRGGLHRIRDAIFGAMRAESAGLDLFGAERTIVTEIAAASRVLCQSRAHAVAVVR